MRRIHLPAAAHKRLNDVLSFEVEATLPFEPDDAVMDHRLLTFVKGVDEEGQIPIFSGVAYTEEVRDRIGLVLPGTAGAAAGRGGAATAGEPVLGGAGARPARADLPPRARRGRDRGGGAAPGRAAAGALADHGASATSPPKPTRSG